ncbi:site-specific integrase [Herbaspirillum sp. HC18]|nr:site-specific integrase [Herbaspirillum sp. HC18]
MSTIKPFANGTFQLRVSSKLLDKPLYATFDTLEQAQAYGTQLEGLLAQGIVPKSLLERTKTGQEIWTVSRCISEYLRENSVPVSDIKLLNTIRPLLATASTGHLNYDWAEGWVRRMKRIDNLSPSTIRHRHGALARCFDWMLRKHPGVMAQNPLRLLKRGFATYTEEDKKLLIAAGKAPKVDVERDRRLPAEEESLILRHLGQMPDEKTFFVLALESAMRMRECYTLTIHQISLKKRTVHLDRTKNGDSRQVPLTSTASALLDDYMKQHARQIKERDGRLFPFWNGDLDENVLDTTTSEVSRIFRNVFADLEIVDLHFHDLRHEATCRLYERTTLSDVLIAKITGHRNLRMLLRYASLRGSDLAGRLW